MNQQIHEQLSALMDGELDRDQTRFVLKRLPGDDDLAPRWERYHIVRQTLRRQELGAVQSGFAAAVMLRIEDEPSVRMHGALPIWLRWGAGGAIAASVAVAALLVTRPIGDVAPGAMPSGPSIAAQPSVSNAMPVAANSASSDFRAPMRPVNRPVETAPVSFGADLSQPIAIDPQLQSYLLRHYQSASGAGQSTFVPYVLLGTPQREVALPRAQEPVPQQH